MMQPKLHRAARLSALVLCAAALGGCSYMPQLSWPSWLGGSGDKAKPAELPPNPATFGVRQAWMARVGTVDFPLSVATSGTNVVVASSDGTVAMLDGATGREAWRAAVGQGLSAGVGTDGTLVSVVTDDNQLTTLSNGKVLWRERLPAQAYTAPLVAGARVFVLAADRSVSAYDGQSGRRLWTQSRQGEPLVLRQGGVLLPFGDTLLAGLGGRLVAMNPGGGAARWEVPIATPRGTNDVERLVDLVGPVSRVGSSICARAFQAAVGCADAARGTFVWSKPANGGTGVSGDESILVGTESDGRVIAWKRENGERQWNNELFLHRRPSAPLVVGKSVAFGDFEGWLHVLSREDGKVANRIATDGSQIVAAPVMVGQTMVVVTRNGSVFGFVPQ
ncbi:outer membrane protein assembly factor BamB [Ramlibacter algicola]|uniref:Outer membrane protein assembly factor BamB n=1 Tax=Ramlibacter algicola TaxID=2795217 RepID=A0A934URI7_9BURK|nr:outer membrane protein assembly factor BamB [Ramlibacter algicola]MBK0393235.1 outer membrane protein assembly factor BamB [Ramlibacter algicola]